MKFNYVYIIGVLSCLSGLSFAKTLTPVSFSSLPQFEQANLTRSFSALQISCQKIIVSPENIDSTSPLIPLSHRDWLPLCRAALLMKHPSNKTIHQFFKRYFYPVKVEHWGRNTGLFTGYYLPLIHVSYRQNSIYQVPIYARPSDLVSAKLSEFNSAWQGQQIVGRVINGRLHPYNITRNEINHGKLHGKAKILVFAQSRADRYLIEIQGSGIAQLPNGRQILLAYDGSNGQKYVAIGRWFIRHHLMTRKNISMRRIHEWLVKHPKQADLIMDKNPSFVFFKEMHQASPIGTQGVPLTAGYSLAVDQHDIPLGIPVWLATKIPTLKNPVTKHQPFHRLMIAQDTGGAIKGLIRGDIYFGAGNAAETYASHMKHEGMIWLLIPIKINTV